jgi:hypothetical protein
MAMLDVPEGSLSKKVRSGESSTGVRPSMSKSGSVTGNVAERS